MLKAALGLMLGALAASSVSGQRGAQVEVREALYRSLSVLGKPSTSLSKMGEPFEQHQRGRYLTYTWLYKDEASGLDFLVKASVNQKSRTVAAIDFDLPPSRTSFIYFGAAILKLGLISPSKVWAHNSIITANWETKRYGVRMGGQWMSGTPYEIKTTTDFATGKRTEKVVWKKGFSLDGVVLGSIHVTLSGENPLNESFGTPLFAMLMPPLPPKQLRR